MTSIKAVNMPTPRDRLQAAGLTVPTVAAPLASYVPAIQSGRHIYTAGQLPFVDGVLPITGKVGAEVSLEQAIDLARISGLNVIAAVESLLGDLSTVLQVVKLTVFVASDPAFTDQPKVANGASDLMKLAFNDAGIHARSAVGVTSLPLDAPVEIEAIFEVG